jgi:hypothetical protein
MLRISDTSSPLPYIVGSPETSLTLRASVLSTAAATAPAAPRPWRGRHGLDPKDRAVRRVASRPEFGGNVDEAVRPLLHIADAHVELTEQRLAPLRLRGLAEGDALERLPVQRSDEHVVLPVREPVAGYISTAVTGWSPSYLELMLIVVVMYLLLGLFMEPFGAMLVTLPVLLPVFELYDVSLIWFGVLLVKLLEIGMITPPVGMNIFVIRGVAGQYASLVEIFKGVTLFLIADLVVVALVIFYPGIVMFMFDS